MFFGNKYARWNAVIPRGKGYVQSVRNYASAFVTGKPEYYLGHNPLGRLSVFVLFILMITQAITGLVLAGTDLFYPPIGYWIAQWIAAPDVLPTTLLPYAAQMYDAEAFKSMRAFRSPFTEIHEINFYLSI
jgi:cytochrome b